MRSQIKVLFVTIALGPVLVFGPRLPDAMAGMETFRVTDVEVRGIEVLTEDSVVARLQLGAFASVWGDHDAWVDRVTAHPLVRRAEIRRRIPNGLLVTIEERHPVAFAATPLLEPVDAEGYRLPIDPTLYRRFDLPIILTERMPPEGSPLFPEEGRSLAAEAEHLTATHQDFMDRVSTIKWMSEGVIIARLESPAVEFIMPARTTGDRIREGEKALSHAMRADPGRIPDVVDLRFTEQVVVRRSRRRLAAEGTHSKRARGR